MHFAETRQLVDQTCEFPVDHDSVVERLGAVELTAPTGEATTVGETLAPSEETTYHSTQELYATIVGNLTDAFVGRKYYDDRAGVRIGLRDEPTRDEESPTSL